MTGWLVLTWLGLALAADPPTCENVELPAAPAALSVAWVSPVGRTVGRKASVMVVPTRELRGWVGREAHGSTARMLQRLGLRGSPREPKKRWKVVIFDAEPGDLCRPVVGHEEPAVVSGMLTCTPRQSKVAKGQSGCGYTTDRASGEMGLEQFRGTWEDLARNGFCVLPAERFVEDAGG